MLSSVAVCPMDENCTFEQLKPSESECLKALGGFISCLSDSGYEETQLIPKGAAAFLQKLNLQYSDTMSTDASMRLLHQAHSAAMALVRSLQDGLAYLSDQKGGVPGATTQLKKSSCIDTLPDEIIAMVAEKVYGISDQLMAIRFSQVCQRWRRIALNFPCLWCSPMPLFDRKLTHALLMRSRAAPLDIHLDRDRGMEFSNHFTQFIDDIKPHFERCRSFELFLDPDEDENMLEFIEDLGMQCYGLQAPNLETLDIACRTPDGDENRELSLDDGFHFYASWDMPKLRTLHITNFIPRSVFGDSLKSLNAKFLMDVGYETWDMQLLLDFLASVPRIEDLSITLMNSALCFFENGSHSENLSQHDRVSLENVKKLTLEIGLDESDGLRVLRTVLKSIITPNVTDLTLRVDVEKWTKIGDFLELVFVKTKDDRFAHVERLEIQMRKHADLAPCRIEQIFFKLPHLADLTLSMFNGSVGDTLWDLPSCAGSVEAFLGLTPSPIENPVPLPPLRFVRLSGFEDTPNFSSDTARTLAYAMKEGKYWEQLERMEIVGCPSFERIKDLVEETVPRQKLLWTD